MTTQEEIDLRKKEKRIDRNHWMCRLQQYTFDIDATTFYMGYCPFFWMTWVSLIALPFVFLFKCVTGPGVWLWDKCTAPVYTYKQVSREKIANSPLKPTASQLVDIDEDFPLGGDEIKQGSDIRYIVGRVNYERVFLWLQANPNWRTIDLPKAVKELEAAHKAEQKELERLLAKSAKLRKVNLLASTCGSMIFKILIPIVIVIAGGAAAIGLVKLAMIPSLQDYLGGGLIAISLYAAFLFGKIVFSGLTIYLENREQKNPGKSFWITTAVLGTLEWTLEKLVSVTDFIKETVSMTYKQECPLIIWGEETGPIEKRKK